MTCIITLKISHLDKQISCLCRAIWESQLLIVSMIALWS